MKAFPTSCPHCGNALVMTLIVPTSAEDAIQKAERMATCPRCDVPTPARNTVKPDDETAA